MTTTHAMLSEFCVRHKLGEEELKELTKLVDDTIVRIGRCLISAPVAAKEPVAAKPVAAKPVAAKEPVAAKPVAAKEPVAKKPPVVKEAVATKKPHVVKEAVAKEPLPPPPVPAHLRGLVMEQKEQKEQKEEEEINALKVKKTIKRPIAWMKKQQQMMVK